MNVEEMRELIEDSVDYLERGICSHLEEFMRQQNVDGTKWMAVRDAFIQTLIQRLVDALYYLMCAEWDKKIADRGIRNMFERIYKRVIEIEVDGEEQE